MFRHVLALLALFSAVILADCSLQADPKDKAAKSLDGSVSARQFEQVAVSPDGKRIAWVEALPHEKDAQSAGSAIYVAELGDAPLAPRRLTAGDGKNGHSEHNLAWSPDSNSVAFLSDREKPGQLQLYVAAIADLKARKLTRLTGFLDAPSWSPDGKTVALLFTENAPRASGPLGAGTREVGVIEEKIYVQRLVTVSVESGATRLVSPADLYIYEYDWSPDSKRFVATAAHGSGDNNWYIAQLYTIALAAGEATSICKPSMQIAGPRWAPDGETIAFIGGLMSDEGFNSGDIYAVAAAGGKPRNLTPDMKASATSLNWSADSKQIVFAEYADGQAGVARLDLAGGKIATLWTDAALVCTRNWPSMPSVSLARDGKTSGIIRHSFQQPPEVWAGPLGDWKQLTHVNRDCKPPLGETKSIHWQSDGMTVQGWVLYPRDYDPKKRYPMIVVAHGGPSGVHRPMWPANYLLNPAELSAAGYFVLLPNPRGSSGKGQTFIRGNMRDFGPGPLRDIVAGVDEVVKTLPVDNNRVGLMGWSYGGYMTMWAVTQTQRFRAAVAGAGIANWLSYYGQNEIDQWLIPFFGASVYDEPEIYAKNAPITFVKNVKTPTLIVVGERDVECPPAQSREFWHALKTFRVKTQLVIYADEGHHFNQQRNVRDVNKRTVDWFNEHLRPN